MTTPLWTPDPARIADANLTRFTAWLESRTGQSFPDYAALHQYSVTQRGEFWSAIWDFCGVQGDKGARLVVEGDQMPGAGFFPDARLNFTENLLRRHDDTLAILATDETGAERRLTWAELGDQVAACAQQLRDAGVQPGDRVAGFMANVPEAVIAALAAASIGAVWSSCSPDFGVQGVLDRFGQIEPKVLVAISGYHYGGKYHDCQAKVEQIAANLPTLRRILWAPGTPELRDPGTPELRDPGTSSRSPSTIRSTCCIPPAPPASPSASCTATAARCCSI